MAFLCSHTADVHSEHVTWAEPVSSVSSDTLASVRGTSVLS